MVGGASIVPVAGYEYLGHARLVGTELYQPQARSNAFEYASGGPPASPYPDLDRFNRVIHSRWTSDKPTSTKVDFYHIELGYDPASNVTHTIDHVHRNASGDNNFDVLYSLDNLNRVRRADEGELTFPGGVPTIDSGKSARSERWENTSGDLGLSQTGNWVRHLLDLNGDGTFGGTGERNATNTFSLANELLTRDLNSNSSVDRTLAHDKVGNMTEDGHGYNYTYDALGRLTRVWTGSKTIAQYRYNGLNHRIAWRYDTNNTGEVDSGDPWYYFCYDERWRVVATFRADDEHPKEVFVHHAAGLGGGVGGFGGSSYMTA